jgi:histidine triad (HIT) family protein
MTSAYDSSNIFAKMLRGEVPVQALYRDEYALAFADIAPASPTHILIIPTRAAVSFDDFMAHASDAEIAGFF